MATTNPGIATDEQLHRLLSSEGPLALTSGDASEERVTLPERVKSLLKQILAELARGRDVTVLAQDAEIADWLGIKVGEGIEDHVSAMGTIIRVHGHEVTLVLGELSLDLFVYFPAFQHIPRNLLGRQGLLQRFLVGLDDHEGFVYLGYHDDQ